MQCLVAIFFSLEGKQMIKESSPLKVVIEFDLTKSLLIQLPTPSSSISTLNQFQIKYVFGLGGRKIGHVCETHCPKLGYLRSQGQEQC